MAMASRQELMEKAARYRQMAAWLADRQAVQALQELATRYDRIAVSLEECQSLPPTGS